ncbi:hypothetical protein PI23P_10842 [Polaribacter irgensii 23-P]|uniref:Uncharacterized protein n=1 Tax=Polaribacter irgensii 23-P TaxID=313594 RepID=A4C121_9FLAO|nr:hypothetical protein PI23P_10842 [Polaribacter irgensii 23-P]
MKAFSISRNPDTVKGAKLKIYFK